MIFQNHLCFSDVSVSRGILFYEGRPICSRRWDRNSATVLCRALSHADADIEGIPHSGISSESDHKNVTNLHFLFMDIECIGTEKSLTECQNRMNLNPCSAYHSIGVTCLSRQVKLRNGTNEFQGQILIGELPVCAESTWMEDKYSDVICDHLFGFGAISMKTEFHPIDTNSTSLSVILSCPNADKRFPECRMSVIQDPSCKVPSIVCSPCNDSVIMDRVKRVAKVVQSTENLLTDMMLATVDAREKLSTECNVQCEMNDQIHLDWNKLEYRDDIRCSLDLAFAKISKEYNASLEEAKMDHHLRRINNWERVLKSDRRELTQQSITETMEEVSYIFTDMQAEFLDLVEFWSFIDRDPDQQNAWEVRLMAMVTRLTEVEQEGKRLCDRTDWTDYWKLYSHCTTSVAEAFDMFRLYSNYMNETRQMKIYTRWNKSSPEAIQIQAEREKLILEEMGELQRGLKSKQKQDMVTKIKRLYSSMFFRVRVARNMKSACTRLKYMNGGQLPEECSNLSQIPSSFSPVFQHEMCASRQLKKRSVVIPAAFPADGEEMEMGVINLREFFVGEDWSKFMSKWKTRGETKFQIPDVDWLIKHNWIKETEKNQGPFFLREFQIVPLPFVSDTIEVWTRESQLNGETYIFEQEAFFQFDVNRYPNNYRWPNQYNIPNCNKTLDDFHRASRGRSLESVFVPSIFAPWNIIQEIDKRSLSLYPRYLLPIPVPSEIIHLQARVEICLGPVKSPTPIPERYEGYETYPRLSINQTDNKCCNSEKHSFYSHWDKVVEQSCSKCPEGAKPRLYGYYCELCPAGMEPSSRPLGCVPCHPGFSKEKAGMHSCMKCNGSSVLNGTFWNHFGKTQC